MSTSRRVVVIGSGVIGTACAHYLVKSGWSVTVIDRGALGRGSSHANCGLICPSDVLPLAGPGVIAMALRSMLKANSPFAIRPRLSPALWSWLIGFARRCNARDQRASGRAIQPLLKSSIELYPRLVEQEGLDCEWDQRGLLYVYRERAAFEGFAATDRLLTEAFQCPARRLESEELHGFEPALKPGLAGGWYYEHDAQLRPDRLLASWWERLRGQGVAFESNCGFERFLGNGTTATAAVTARGERPADAFVMATGAWTPLLNEQLGCRVPIQPGKGYSLTMARPRACPRLPLLFPETRVAVTPFREGYRLGSTMEFAGYDGGLNRARLQLLKDGAAPYLVEPYTEAVEEEWYGWRPMTYDSTPIIDRAPRHANVVIAAGHNMLGVSMAPATGRLVAELLNGEPPHLDLAPYRVSRF